MWIWLVEDEVQATNRLLVLRGCWWLTLTSKWIWICKIAPVTTGYSTSSFMCTSDWKNNGRDTDPTPKMVLNKKRMHTFVDFSPKKKCVSLSINLLKNGPHPNTNGHHNSDTTQVKRQRRQCASQSWSIKLNKMKSGPSIYLQFNS